MSRRTDSAVGRTGWDVLYTGFVPLIALIALILVCVLAYAFRDSISGSGDAISENIGFLVPLILGLLFGRWIYFRYIRRFVIIQVEEPENNVQHEFEVSEARFKRLKVSGTLNPVVTSIGVPLFRVLSFDQDKGEIVAGWCHDPRTELASVMVSRECWSDLVKHDHDMTVRAERLEQLRYQDALKAGHEMASGLLDALALPPLDKDPKGESEDDLAS